MRSSLRIGLGLVVGVVTLQSWAAGNGLVARPEAFAGSRWQARLEIDTTPLAARWAGQPLALAGITPTTRLLGDYHLDALKFRKTSGLRLTSGVLLTAPPQGLGLAAEHRRASPYLGIGYAGAGLKGNWGFSADVGLAVQNPGATSHFGRVVQGDLGLSDALRDLRLQPMVRLGMSYRF